MTKSTFSHHLRILREAGVLTKRIQGTKGYTRVRKDDLDRRFPGLIDAIIDAENQNLHVERTRDSVLSAGPPDRGARYPLRVRRSEELVQLEGPAQRPDRRVALASPQPRPSHACARPRFLVLHAASDRDLEGGRMIGERGGGIVHRQRELTLAVVDQGEAVLALVAVVDLGRAGQVRGRVGIVPGRGLQQAQLVP